MPHSIPAPNPYDFVGKRVPAVQLATLKRGELRQVMTEDLFAGRRALIIGVPGAFTPVCSQRHVPDIVAQAERLAAAGFSVIACVTSNDPWVNDAWARQIDPRGKLTMLSDGNLDLVRAMGLTVGARELFLGERSQRFMLQLKDSVVEKIGIERDILTVSCTRADDIILAA